MLRSELPRREPKFVENIQSKQLPSTENCKKFSPQRPLTTAGICYQRNGVQGSVCMAAILSRRCSASGQKRTFRYVQPMSALPPIADIGISSDYVRRSSSGSLAILTAILRASTRHLPAARVPRNDSASGVGAGKHSLVSSLAADCRPGSSSK